MKTLKETIMESNVPQILDEVLRIFSDNKLKSKCKSIIKDRKLVNMMFDSLEEYIKYIYDVTMIHPNSGHDATKSGFLYYLDDFFDFRVDHNDYTFLYNIIDNYYDSENDRSNCKSKLEEFLHTILEVFNREVIVKHEKYNYKIWQ